MVLKLATRQSEGLGFFWAGPHHQCGALFEEWIPGSASSDLKRDSHGTLVDWRLSEGCQCALHILSGAESSRGQRVKPMGQAE